MPVKWDSVSSEEVFANQWIALRREVSRVPGRDETAEFYVVEKSDFAMVVALAQDGQVILVRQYKHGSKSVVLECPAGYIEPGETGECAAERELLEETGYVAGSTEALGAFHVSPSFATLRANLFLCRDCRLQSTQSLDATEDIEVVVSDFGLTVESLLQGGLEVDLASAVALLLAAQRVHRQSGA